MTSLKLDTALEFWSQIEKSPAALHEFLTYVTKLPDHPICMALAPNDLKGFLHVPKKYLTMLGGGLLVSFRVGSAKNCLVMSNGRISFDLTANTKRAQITKLIKQFAKDPASTLNFALNGDTLTSSRVPLIQHSRMQSSCNRLDL